MTEESLFLEALDTPPGERAAFLDGACEGDPELRGRLEQLLAAVDRPDGILERGTHLRHRGTTLAVDELFAGRFKLRQKLGEGGMGEVWVADQSEPVQRRVALKMIRPGLDSTRLLARFDQERQALALMDHPNIAKVLDAGVAAGRPYFVMELIKGVPITKYCDDAKLTPRERLALFIPVCQAVQHAHQKGIIHRDLKPANILVALYDGVPVPKIIDFGVAKATGPRIAPGSVYTEVGSLVGTVEYMSPEQAELNNLDVDTRSDVYALGVVLYELLTGTVPFTRQTLQSATFVEMLRIIKEDAPPKPSTRLSGETRPDVAAVRRTPPAKLASTVRGDLDWIVMKCLEKERARRYETANGLAADLTRYLANEPVLAGPPTAGYRLRKFLGRNRGPAVAASLVVVALLAGIVGTSVGLVRARAARDDARERAEGERIAKEKADKRAEGERIAKEEAHNRAEGERLAKEESQRRLKQVEKGIDILLAFFHSVTQEPGSLGARPIEVVLGEQLVVAARALDADAIADPLLVARLRHGLADAMTRVGRKKEALTELEKAHATRVRLLGADDPTTIASEVSLAVAAQNTNDGKRALELYEDALRRLLARERRDTEQTVRIRRDLAALHGYGPGNRGKALGQLRAVVAFHVREHPGEPLTFDVMSQLVNLLHELRRFPEELAAARELVDACRRHPPADGFWTRSALGSLAGAHIALHQFTEAIATLQELLDLTRIARGPSDADTLFVMTRLADAHCSNKDWDRGLKMHEDVLTLREGNLRGNHPLTILDMYRLGRAYIGAGRAEQSIPLLERAAREAEKLPTPFPDHPHIVFELCRQLEASGDHARAEPWRRKDLELSKRRVSAMIPGAHGAAHEALARNLMAQMKHAEAVEALLKARAAYQAMEVNLTPEKRAGRVAHVCRMLAEVHDAWGKPDEAAAWRKEMEALGPKRK